MIEASRRHGWFDVRFTSCGRLPARAVATALGIPEGLDWEAFSALAFPDGRRHDSQAIKAYADYGRSARA